MSYLPKGKATSFLKLPTEIRLKVYRCLFHSAENLTLSDDRQLSAQLLRTCNLVHNEGAPVLYGENQIDITSVSGHKLYDRIGCDNIRHMRHLLWCWDPTESSSSGVDSFLDFLHWGREDGKKLQTLEIYLMRAEKYPGPNFTWIMSKVFQIVVASVDWRELVHITGFPKEEQRRFRVISPSSRLLDGVCDPQQITVVK